MPNPSWSSASYAAALEGSANMVEVVEIPFSDPIADGREIQAAAKRELAAGIKVSGCIKQLTALRARFPHPPVGIQTRAARFVMDVSR